MILTKSILEHWWTTGINLLIGLYVLTMSMIPVADGGEHRLSHPNVRNRNYGYVNYWIGHYRVDIRPWQAELLCNSWWYSASSQNNDTSNFWKYIQDVAVFRDHPRYKRFHVLIESAIFHVSAGNTSGSSWIIVACIIECIILPASRMKSIELFMEMHQNFTFHGPTLWVFSFFLSSQIFNDNFASFRSYKVE